jgi:hypothetical protein
MNLAVKSLKLYQMLIESCNNVVFQSKMNVDGMYGELNSRLIESSSLAIETLRRAQAARGGRNLVPSPRGGAKSVSDDDLRQAASMLADNGVEMVHDLKHCQVKQRPLALPAYVSLPEGGAVVYRTAASLGGISVPHTGICGAACASGNQGNNRGGTTKQQPKPSASHAKHPTTPEIINHFNNRGPVIADRTCSLVPRSARASVLVKPRKKSWERDAEELAVTLSRQMSIPFPSEAESGAALLDARHREDVEIMAPLQWSEYVGIKARRAEGESRTVVTPHFIIHEPVPLAIHK